MKFSTTAKAFAKALKAIGSAGREGQGCDPAWACVRIQASGGVVTLAATDSQGIAVYARLADAVVEEDGVCAVNFRRLQKTLTSAKKSAVDAVFCTNPKALRGGAELAVGKTRAAMDIGDADGAYADRLGIGAEPPDGECVPLDIEAAKIALSIALETADEFGEYLADHVAVEPSLGLLFATDGGHSVAIRNACAGLGGQFIVPRAAVARALRLGTEDLELVTAGGGVGAIRALDGSAVVAYCIGNGGREYPSVRQFLKLAAVQGASAAVAGADLRRLCEVLEPFVTAKDSTAVTLHLGDGACLAVRYDCGDGVAPSPSTPSADFTVPAQGDLRARLSIHYRYLRDIAKGAGDGTAELLSSGDLYVARLGRVEYFVAPYAEQRWASQKSCILKQEQW